MKKKLIAAMLLLTVQINGMDQVIYGSAEPRVALNLRRTVDSFVNRRALQIENYYTKQSKEIHFSLEDLNKVICENHRRSFFEKLVLNNKYISDDEALLEFIRAAATAIIHSPEYSDESLMDYSDESAPDYVYQPPFLFTLVERLDPITWHYMRKVRMAEGQ